MLALKRDIVFRDAAFRRAETRLRLLRPIALAGASQHLHVFGDDLVV